VLGHPSNDVEKPSDTNQSSKIDENVQSQSQSSQSKDWYVVDKIERCVNYRGKRYYKVKWQGLSKRTWELESNIPNVLIQDFHIHKTLTGRAKRKRKK
jgi:hypothetical protein